MEPRDRAAQEVTERPDARRLATALRLVAACVLLVGLAFIQTPGLPRRRHQVRPRRRPGDVPRRGPCTCGTPQGAFGQLQNQAYGYLWPMGPFFALGDLRSTSRAGSVQRLWWRWCMCVAFLGTAAAGPGARRPVRPRVPRRRVRLRAVAADAHACSARSRSRPGPAPWRRGCCCRWSSARAAGSPRRAAAARPPSRSPWSAASTRRPRSRCSRSASSGC